MYEVPVGKSVQIAQEMNKIPSASTWYSRNPLENPLDTVLHKNKNALPPDRDPRKVVGIENLKIIDESTALSDGYFCILNVDATNKLNSGKAAGPNEIPTRSV
ncbi:hypothetical protein ElyMa_003407800 [Elysia marginata]|uniref:Uncharacterized protein n=1 Tax=Elysia marginata TaxID=1093978 RepID=A0AAV4JMZ8_9GAST|nr:hypothetical protein ElyMa_003407800 [Elysia marginata]